MSTWSEEAVTPAGYAASFEWQDGTRLVPAPDGTAVAYTRGARNNFATSEVYRFHAHVRYPRLE